MVQRQAERAAPYNRQRFAIGRTDFKKRIEEERSAPEPRVFVGQRIHAHEQYAMLPRYDGDSSKRLCFIVTR